MLHKKHVRIIAILMVLMFCASLAVVPTGDSKDKPKKSSILWAALTTLEDILSGIDRLLAVIRKDVEKMENMLADINDELIEKWYPKRDKKEDELKEAQDELDKLNAEYEAAKDKKRNAEALIKSLKRDIRQRETALKNLSPGETEKRAVLEAEIAMLKSQLESAEQVLKEAKKITSSQWHNTKRWWYEYIIGGPFSGLTQELIRINNTVRLKEEEADTLQRLIDEKTTEEENEGTRREQTQKDVDAKRKEYNEQKKKEDAEDEK